MSDYDPEASATRLASCVESEDGGHLVDGRLGLLPPPGHGESGICHWHDKAIPLYQKDYLTQSHLEGQIRHIHE